MFSESQIPQELCSLRSEIWIPLRTQKLKYFALFIILFFMCMYRVSVNATSGQYYHIKEEYR